MKNILILAAAILFAISCTGSAQSIDFPKVNQDSKIAIVAHRGFWNCEQAGYCQNTIASLKMAQEAGFWGSEFDVQLTRDNVAVINHDSDIQGMVIAEHNYDELSKLTFPNGEHLSTLDEYLTQGEKCSSTVLVCELKTQANQEKEDILMAVCLEAVKAHGLYSPDRLIFITFSHYMSQKLAETCPEFTNQYLNGDFCPSELMYEGINGIDYNSSVLRKHPLWIKEAHDNSMSVNVWTVDKAEDIQYFSEQKVDAITTNYPLLARELLGSNEFKF